MGPAGRAETMPGKESAMWLLSTWTRSSRPPRIEWTPTRPSKLAAAMTAGLRGHQAASKHHWLLVDSSASTSPLACWLFVFQISTRLSLPQLSSRSESYGTKTSVLWQPLAILSLSNRSLRVSCMGLWSLKVIIDSAPDRSERVWVV